MSKKTFMATIIVLAFLISLVAGMFVFKVAEANPVPIMPPTSPVTEPPIITIQAPSDTTYYSDNVQLNFTITGCDHGLVSPYDNPNFYHLSSVSFILDGQTNYLNFSEAQDVQQFSTVLTGLTSGNHNVTINVVAKSLYATNVISLGNNSFRYTENDYYPRASQSIDFVVGETPTHSTPSPIPTQSISPSPTPITTYGLNGPAPSPPFRMDLQGFTNESSPPSGFPKMILRQGETGILKVNLTQGETNDNVSVKLWFYGIAPNFDAFQNTWDPMSMSLPAGITYSLDPSTVLLSNNATFSATLAISAASNARVGDYKVIVDAWFSPSHSGNGTAGISKPLILEIAKSSSETGGLSVTLALIVVVGVLLSAFVILVYLKKRRGFL
jgi:hypothetical protein